MKISKTALLLILLIIIINARELYSKEYLEYGKEFIYIKSIDIKRYTSTAEETIYSSIFRGSCIEESKYIVIGTSTYGFSIEKKVLKIRNYSSSIVVCNYLKIIDYGNAFNLKRNNSLQEDIMFFTWDFQYSGPVLQVIYYNEIPIPWLNNTFIYIPPRFARDIRKYESTISPSNVIEGKVVNFYYSLDLQYSLDNGLLKKLNCLITINLDKKPYILINIVIEEKQSNILEFLYNLFIEIIMNYWKYVIPILLTITTIIIIYRKT